MSVISRKSSQAAPERGLYHNVDTNLNESSFLEPPHQYSLEGLSEYLNDPPLSDVEQELAKRFQAVYLSVSIVLASLQRMKHLHKEAEETEARLNCNYGQAPTLEMSLYNAQRRLNAERRYFVDEAIPDLSGKQLALKAHLSWAFDELPTATFWDLYSWLTKLKELIRKFWVEFDALQDNFNVLF
ncbi:hypothetical protein RBB50_012675 [Rhinocladiella similis]